jgi:hypothetical protein
MKKVLRNTSNELTGLIKRLTVIRKQHVAALEEIESTFRQFGIERLLNQPGRGGKRTSASEAAGAGRGKPGRKRRKGAVASVKETAGKRRGPKPGARKGKKAGRRVRGTFEITGDELILRFVRKLGCPTTEEIRRHWESEGRGGKAENNLTNLVKTGKLVRNRIPGQMRSTYSIPPSSAE